MIPIFYLLIYPPDIDTSGTIYLVCMLLLFVSFLGYCCSRHVYVAKNYSKRDMCSGCWVEFLRVRVELLASTRQNIDLRVGSRTFVIRPHEQRKRLLHDRCPLTVIA